MSLLYGKLKYFKAILQNLERHKFTVTIIQSSKSKTVGKKSEAFISFIFLYFGKDIRNPLTTLPSPILKSKISVWKSRNISRKRNTNKDGKDDRKFPLATI